MVASPSAGFQGEIRLYQIVARRIGAMIDDHRGDPTWKVPAERDLAEMLEVSRPVIREAMIALEVTGILSVRGRSGAVVLPSMLSVPPAIELPNNVGTAEILAALEAIEPSIVAMAASTDNRDLSGGWQMVDRMADLEPWRALDVEAQLVAMIAKIAGNQVLAATLGMYRKTWAAAVRTEDLSQRLYGNDERLLMQGDFRTILHSIAAGKPAAARTASSRYLRSLRDGIGSLDDDESELSHTLARSTAVRT